MIFKCEEDEQDTVEARLEDSRVIVRCFDSGNAYDREQSAAVPLTGPQAIKLAAELVRLAKIADPPRPVSVRVAGDELGTWHQKVDQYGDDYPPPAPSLSETFDTLAARYGLGGVK
jgi:hypothetical protein